MMLESAEPLHWAEIGTQYVGFLGSFALYGAVGARVAAPRIAEARTGLSARMANWGALAGRRVATIGLLGGIAQVVAVLLAVSERAAERHASFAATLASGGSGLTGQLVLIAAALLGFVLARFHVRAGWWIAGAAALALALRNVTSGKWAALVNPLHVLAGGLWLGTLAVLVVALFPLLLRGDAVGRDPDVRPGGSRLDAVVRRFSRLALASSALLGVTGVITAWRHLGALDALWTTPYGWALDVKLLLVATIAAFGFYNWRVATPTLSAGSGDARLARTSLREVSLGLLVLAVTAILVSLPAPAERASASSGHGAPAPTAPAAPH